MELTIEQALQQGVAAHNEGKLEEVADLNGFGVMTHNSFYISKLA